MIFDHKQNYISKKENWKKENSKKERRKKERKSEKEHILQEAQGSTDEQRKETKKDQKNLKRSNK